MSADNWRDCPRCTKYNLAVETELRDRQREELAAAYGKVSASAYEALKEQHVLQKPVLRPADSLREDYELGIRGDGVRDPARFEVSYGGACQNGGCDFEFTFEESKAVS